MYSPQPSIQAQHHQCGTGLNRVQRAICSGFFRHVAKKDSQEGYKTLVEGTPVYIHPASALFNRVPKPARWAWCHPYKMAFIIVVCIVTSMLYIIE